MWDPFRAPGYLGAEESYTVSDALAVGVWLNVFVRQSKYLGMCNIAQSVNVISPLMTTESGLIKQTTYWPLLLYSKYMRGKTLAIQLQCGEWKSGRTNPEWIRSTLQTPWLDVSAALDDSGWVNMSVVNISENEDLATKIDGISATPQVFLIGGSECNGVGESNMKGGKLGIVEKRWHSMDGVYVFPRHSLTLIRWKAEAEDI